jgi:hypothetical protein
VAKNKGGRKIMPCRVVKDSLLSSQSMARLSAEGERHFIRLLLLKDDWGCFEATPGFIKGHCYMYHDNITSLQVITYNNELETNGDLRFWKIENRIYGIFSGHEKHDNRYSVSDDGNVTRHRRKTPEPPDSIFTDKYKPVFTDTIHMITTDNTLSKRVSNPNHSPEHIPNPIKTKPLAPVGAGYNFFKIFFDKYLEHRKEKYTSFNEKKEAGLLKNICKKITQVEYELALDRFHALSDNFVKGNGYNVVAFTTKLQGLLSNNYSTPAKDIPPERDYK